MSDISAVSDRCHVDSRDVYFFINRCGKTERFSISRPSVNLWYGRPSDGFFGILVRIPGPRWVLMVYPDQFEPTEDSGPPNRELFSHQAVSWLNANDYPVPDDLWQYDTSLIGVDLPSAAPGSAPIESALNGIIESALNGIAEPLAPSASNEKPAEPLDEKKLTTDPSRSSDQSSPAQPPEALADLSIVPASGTAIPEATIPRGNLKEPSKKAIDAYRAVMFLGQKQETVAPKFGVVQGTVSRWVKQVSSWIAAGNLLPNLDAPKPKTITMDPRKLEQGPPRRAHKPPNMRDPSL
jgi:hypothetical protein